MKKIFITGGNGFIGKYLCYECEKSGIDYMSVSNLKPENLKHERQIDILDSDQLMDILLDYQPDAIIHLAAIASPIHGNLSEIYNVNVGGTENLLISAQKALPPGTRLILTSTAGVYGNQPVRRLSEDLPFNPINHYSFSKMVTELLSKQYSDYLDIHIVRPFNIVGVGQNENFLVPKLVKHFACKTPEINMGNMGAYRDYVSVEFCAKVFLMLATCERNIPDIVNICSGIGHSCQDVVDMLIKITGFVPKINSTNKYIRKNEVWSLVGDTARINSLVEGMFQTPSLEEILKDMLQEYENAI